jgi:hypothetical protein
MELRHPRYFAAVGGGVEADPDKLARYRTDG